MAKLVPEKEHLRFFDQKHDNTVLVPLTRKIPAWAPKRESKVVEFKKSQRTENERENIKKEDMNTRINKLGDHRAFTLFLFDKKDSTSESKERKKLDQQIKNAQTRHAEMMASIMAKAIEVEDVGGTPLSIPEHFYELPKKVQK